MPATEEGNQPVLATCAGDGEVRLHDLTTSRPTVFRHHSSRVKKMVTEPGNPHLLITCSEDGSVHQLDVRQSSGTAAQPRHSQLLQLARNGVKLEINSISAPTQKPWLLAVGASDATLRVYDRRMSQPGRQGARGCRVRLGAGPSPECSAGVLWGCLVLQCVDFDAFVTQLQLEWFWKVLSVDDAVEQLECGGLKVARNQRGRLASAVLNKSQDLFEKGEVEPSLRYRGHLSVKTVKDVSFVCPDESLVAAGSDDGRMFIWDRTSGALVTCLRGDQFVVNCIESHPHLPLLVSCGIDKTVKLWSPCLSQPRVLDSSLMYCLGYNELQRAAEASLVDPGFSSLCKLFSKRHAQHLLEQYRAEQLEATAG
eukprot:gene5038-5280_t